MINMIWAQSRDGFIGDDGTIPWNVPEDLKLFRLLTEGHTVVMGRKTWDSLRLRPLPKRRNLVLSRTSSDLGKDVEVVTSVEEVLKLSGIIWIIGGAEIYNLFMPYAERLYVTTVNKNVFHGDTVAPQIDELEFYDLGIDMFGISENGTTFNTLVWERTTQV